MRRDTTLCELCGCERKESKDTLLERRRPTQELFTKDTLFYLNFVAAVQHNYDARLVSSAR